MEQPYAKICDYSTIETAYAEIYDYSTIANGYRMRSDKSLKIIYP